jgi:hypothetical protein
LQRPTSHLPNAAILECDVQATSTKNNSKQHGKVPPPLILAAWHETSPKLKMLRLEEHINWAFENGNFEKISNYLRGLKEDQWFHIDK